MVASPNPRTPPRRAPWEDESHVSRLAASCGIELRDQSGGDREPRGKLTLQSRVEVAQPRDIGLAGAITYAEHVSCYEVGLNNTGVDLVSSRVRMNTLARERVQCA